MKKMFLILSVLAMLVIGRLAQAEPGVFINKDPLPSGTTYYVLVDHSDQTNFKHSDATSTGTTYVDDLIFSGLNTVVKLGCVTAINGSFASIEWFKLLCAGTSTSSVVISPRVPLMVNSGQTQFMGTVENDTNVKSSSIFAIYSTGTTSPAVGDIMIKATNTGASAWFSLLMQYYTLP